VSHVRAVTSDLLLLTPAGSMTQVTVIQRNKVA